jgi:glutathione S-transferase
MRWFHLGLSVEFVYLDFFRGDLQAPQYLAINPNGMVPTLQDGDLMLWESNAIMQYLADGVPENALYPRDRRTRAPKLPVGRAGSWHTSIRRWACCRSRQSRSRTS